MLKYKLEYIYPSPQRPNGPYSRGSGKYDSPKLCSGDGSKGLPSSSSPASWTRGVKYLAGYRVMYKQQTTVATDSRVSKIVSQIEAAPEVYSKVEKTRRDTQYICRWNRLPPKNSPWGA